MEAVFLKLLNMSITASWLVVAVVLLRFILKKAPKIVSLILWALVGIRLILPISFESVFSLVPSAQTFPSDFATSSTPTINSGIPTLDSNLNTIITQSPSPIIPGGTQIFDPNTNQAITQAPNTSASPMETIVFIASIVWAAGVAVMLLYALVSYIRLRLKVREAVKSEGNIMLCDHIASPFILGLIRPKIYIPSSTDVRDVYYVLAHENAHLKRRDHFWKPLGFFLLSIYWFNPVLWVAYILLCRDIELACDEKVIKSLGIESKKPYSTALVNCSVTRKAITVCPLAFGEVGVKKRVKTVLNYKKPAFWIIIVALLICIAVAVCFLTNPLSSDNNPTTNPSTTNPTTTNPNTDSTIPEKPIVTDPDITKITTPSMSWTGKFTKDPYIDDIECDLDGDGSTELVRIYNGVTEKSYVIAVWQNSLKYFGTFNLTDKATWNFDGFSNGVLNIKQTVNGEVSTLKLTVKNGQLSLEGNNLESTKHTTLANGVLNRASTFYFDVDADGIKERCSVVPDTENPYEYFKFIVTTDRESFAPEYYNAFSYDGIDKLEFIVNDAGRIVLQGNRNGNTVTFDIRIENGTIVLTEKDGTTLPYVNKPFSVDVWNYLYDFDYPNSSMFFDVDGDGKKETIYIGYSIPTLDANQIMVTHPYLVCVTDGERYMFCYSLRDTIIEKEADGKVYITVWNDYYEKWDKIGLLMIDEDGNYEFNGEAVGLLPI